MAFSQLCNAEAFNIGLENCPPSPFIGNWDRPGFGILVCFFVNTLSMLMIYPVIPFIVADFFPEMNKEELGYRVGYLASAYQVGNLCSTYSFSRAADIFG